jgi:DNA-directed RNA polymerase specialized sigma24 family protein
MARSDWELELVATALQRLEESPRNCLIFIDLAIREVPVTTVCKRYDISRSNVDTIKHRVRKKLQPIIKDLRSGLI